jgi:hypothetical protein
MTQLGLAEKGLLEVGKSWEYGLALKSFKM